MRRSMRSLSDGWWGPRNMRNDTKLNAALLAADPLGPSCRLEMLKCSKEPLIQEDGITDLSRGELCHHGSLLRCLCGQGLWIC